MVSIAFFRGARSIRKQTDPVNSGVVWAFWGEISEMFLKNRRVSKRKNIADPKAPSMRTISCSICALIVAAFEKCSADWRKSL